MPHTRCILPLLPGSSGPPQGLPTLFSFFNLPIYLSRPGKRFLFIDLAIGPKNQESRATCTTSNAMRARRREFNTKGTSFSSNSRYPVFFRWELREQLANESKQASYASKDINEEERQDAVIFYIFLDFVLELGFVSFYGISALG